MHSQDFIVASKTWEGLGVKINSDVAPRQTLHRLLKVKYHT